MDGGIPVAGHSAYAVKHYLNTLPEIQMLNERALCCSPCYAALRRGRR